jgi:cytochrome P450
LRSFPGPKLWAASSIPFTRISLSGLGPSKILELHKRYGEVVRIRPGELSFIDPSAWKDLKGQKKPGQDENGKDPAIVASSALKDSILGAERNAHARFRRALAPGFSSKAMLAQEPLIQSYVDLLIRRMREQCAGGAKPLDLRYWFSYFTFDVIGDLAFGEPFDCLRNADYHPWVAIIIRVMQALLYLGVTRRYLPGLDTVLPKITPKKVSAAQKRHGQLTRDKVAKRLALSSTRPDFIDAMLNSEQDGDEKLSLAEIESNASVLIVAGSETTATALTAVAYYLCLHPGILARLTKEIRPTFKTEAEIDIVSVGQLKYLIAVLDEALRMYPPAPWAQPRKIRVNGDVIAGKFVPEGVSLLVVCCECLSSF